MSSLSLIDPDGRFIFSATKEGVPYEVDIELFDKVNVEESKYNIGVRSIVYVVKQAEKRWWDGLLKQEGKPPVFVKVDWDKWVDEEDENERSGMDFDNMDFSKQSNPKKRKTGKQKNQLSRLLRKLKLDCLRKQ
ncbi:hypothetical protein SLE2022_066820 [Rubroshorea leprosula]